MSALELCIGKSKYVIQCQEDEKEKITELAAKVNAKVNDLSLQMRGADEKTTLVLSLIMAEAELEEFRNLNPYSTKKSVEKIDNAVQIKSKDIENLSFFIEDLANKIEKC